MITTIAQYRPFFFAKGYAGTAVSGGLVLIPSHSSSSSCGRGGSSGNNSTVPTHACDPPCMGCSVMVSCPCAIHINNITLLIFTFLLGLIPD